MLTEEEIQSQLAGDAVRGPRLWRGRPLSKLTRGLRSVRDKVIAPDDTAEFHDLALLHILAEAHGEEESERLDKRAALLLETDNVPRFRARISLMQDELGEDPEAMAEVRRLADEILGLVDAATVSLQKKTGAPAPAEPSPTMTPSSSPPSPEKPAGRKKPSSGKSPK